MHVIAQGLAHDETASLFHRTVGHHVMSVILSHLLIKSRLKTRERWVLLLKLML